MDERARHMMDLSFPVIIFIVALELFIGSYRMISSGLQQAYEVNSAHDRSITTTLEQTERYQVSGASIISLIYLLEKGGAPIVIEGARYVSGTPVEDINVSRIQTNKLYSPRVDRDANGVIQQITYT